MGASVVIADLNAEQLELARHEVGAHGMVVGNITAESDCDEMVARTVELCEGLDAVVNAAGVSDRVGPALDIEMEAWQRVVDIHLRGAFAISRAAARHLLPNRRGSIVHVLVGPAQLLDFPLQRVDSLLAVMLAPTR
jgi:NAD(P)-dependent dehydrogenase (short-subunit alcohol dehydrogenase family)